jgi:hypothetical protein
MFFLQNLKCKNWLMHTNSSFTTTTLLSSAVTLTFKLGTRVLHKTYHHFYQIILKYHHACNGHMDQKHHPFVLWQRYLAMLQTQYLSCGHIVTKCLELLSNSKTKQIITLEPCFIQLLYMTTPRCCQFSNVWAKQFLTIRLLETSLF